MLGASGMMLQGKGKGRAGCVCPCTKRGQAWEVPAYHRAEDSLVLGTSSAVSFLELLPV